MFSKILSSVSALLVVMITILPSSKVEAQSLVVFALIDAVVGFNKNEATDFFGAANRHHLRQSLRMLLTHFG